MGIVNCSTHWSIHPLRPTLPKQRFPPFHAGALAVNVGHFNDPRDRQGLAHFLEHMLFQGTKKYPDEHEYSEYIKNHGGYDNAFTSTEDTNFHFECSNEGFEGALDRLAQFFISPCFSENSSGREVQAVDSEFKMSL